MITLIATCSVQAAVGVKAFLQRCVRAVTDAKVRRIQREIELHRRLNDYRRAHDPLGPEGWRGRF